MSRLPQAHRLIRAGGIAAAALLLASCTAIKLSYNKLDWIASWQLGRFVDLAPPQRLLFDREFDEFWAWHRATQLRLYARDLREFSARADRPLDAAAVEDYLNRSQAHLARTLKEIAPDAAAVLATFDDAQVAELLGELAERRREKAEESADLTPDELREQAVEQMERNLKRWVGSLTRPQKARIREWARQRQYAGTVWHQYQEAWAAAFTEVLKHRREPGFEQRVAQLLGEARVPYDEAMVKVQRHNRALWIGVMADLSAMLTPAQRRHLKDKVDELAADLDELATQRNGHATSPAGA